MTDGQLRLALLGGLKEYHAQAFARIFNDPQVRSAAAAKGYPPMQADARVSVCWDSRPDAARVLADKFNIERIAASAEEAVELADAVIVPDNRLLTHQLLALKVVGAKKPIFIDKPMARTAEEARGIAQRAELCGTPVFSSSALPYSLELEKLMPTIREEGGVRLAVACGPVGRFLYYGIHPVSLVMAAVGTGVQRVESLGAEPHHLTRLSWADGRQALVICDERARKFPAILHTEKGVHMLNVRDQDYYYYNLMRHFILMAVTGQAPAPIAQAIEIISICEQVEKASPQPAGQ